MPISLPPQAYAPNSSLRELRTAELFVVTSLRLWNQESDEFAPDWRSGFVHGRITVAGRAGFDALLRIVAVASTEFGVHPLAAETLSADEGRLLQLVSLLQQGRLATASTLLEGWLPPSAIRLAIEPARVFASALAARGLIIPLRHGETSSRHRATATGHAVDVSILVH